MSALALSSEGLTRPAFEIRAEAPADVAAREALLDRAMGPGRKRKSSEAIRRGRLPAEGLAFSALDGSGALTGTVRLWNIGAGMREGAAVPALLLGPLAVDPRQHGGGLGSAMMREAIADAQKRGHGAIILVGDPEYYARFGFSAEKTGALFMPGPFERHRLLALELIPGWLDGVAGRITPTGRKIERRRVAA
ncbi:GNAT family N-acetyltransferase [Consotaella salsifontis]|uniref:Predicted N-acetyltransferase YhbS n=1 Tax=Consotaella salsifontis TaxID=1365950 RepID=A0A1T4NKV7_9HYPH|nr:N-acetyltransferase [Consotaella salsifontis]SJZ79911.1 Predicted N-acetyltransferase YhbS [Consotaella salsifontis]